MDAVGGQGERAGVKERDMKHCGGGEGEGGCRWFGAGQKGMVPDAKRTCGSSRPSY
jgi:hypothetical protein